MGGVAGAVRGTFAVEGYRVAHGIQLLHCPRHNLSVHLGARGWAARQASGAAGMDRDGDTEGERRGWARTPPFCRAGNRPRAGGCSPERRRGSPLSRPNRWCICMLVAWHRNTLKLVGFWQRLWGSGAPFLPGQPPHRTRFFQHQNSCRVVAVGSEGQVLAPRAVRRARTTIALNTLSILLLAHSSGSGPWCPLGTSPCPYIGGGAAPPEGLTRPAPGWEWP